MRDTELLAAREVIEAARVLTDDSGPSAFCENRECSFCALARAIARYDAVREGREKA